MKDLHVTLIQTDLYWENPTANLAMLEEKIAQIPQPTDLIVLPEMFNTGFSMNVSAMGEPMNFTTFKWMKQQAAATGAVITGSFIVKEKDKFFNRLIWMQPNGEFDVYDKKHLFRMGEENENFSAGNQLIIKELKGWKICPLICYDLRFPVWSRNINLAFDVLIYVANWPAVRSHVWTTLAQARAIENSVYVLAVNRVGTDGKGLVYSGNSAVIDFKGQANFLQPNQEIIHQQTLNYQALEDFRKVFPVHLDADGFSVNSEQ